MHVSTHTRAHSLHTGEHTHTLTLAGTHRRCDTCTHKCTHSRTYTHRLSHARTFPCTLPCRNCSDSFSLTISARSLYVISFLSAACSWVRTARSWMNSSCEQSSVWSRATDQCFLVQECQHTHTHTHTHTAAAAFLQTRTLVSVVKRQVWGAHPPQKTQSPTEQDHGRGPLKHTRHGRSRIQTCTLWDRRQRNTDDPSKFDDPHITCARTGCFSRVKAHTGVYPPASQFRISVE